VRQRTDAPANRCANRAMHTTSHSPTPDPSTVTPGRGLPKPAPVPGPEPDFPERQDDPDEAEELERQQDA
jgi:hypothetical protein